MNVGIKNSSGDIIFGILNSDDIYFKNTLKLLINILINIII